MKSHSANALHPEQSSSFISPPKIEDSQETRNPTASTDTIVPINRDIKRKNEKSVETQFPVARQQSESVIPSLSRFMAENPGYFERSLSAVETPAPSRQVEAMATHLSERAARIRAAREKFLSSTTPMRREGTSSASDLTRPGDR